MLKRLVRALIPLRLRTAIRVFLHRYPYDRRVRFPEIGRLRLPLRPVVFDAGANVGDFAEAMIAFRPWVRLHCFEPLPDAFATLQQTVGSYGGIALNNFALGAHSGRSELLVSRFGEASSFLELGRVLEERVYGIDFTIERRIDVPVETISDYVLGRGVDRIDLLKMDVQGFEIEVLRGAEKVLDRVDWIYTEVQFLELYRGGPHADDIKTFLAEHGFDFVRSVSLRHDDSGQLMECDMLFRRRR